MLDQRRRHWADVVQMLYKCFVFADLAGYIKTGKPSTNFVSILHKCRRQWANIRLFRVKSLPLLGYPLQKIKQFKILSIKHLVIFK